MWGMGGGGARAGQGPARPPPPPRGGGVTKAMTFLVFRLDPQPFDLSLVHRLRCAPRTS